MPYFHEWVEPTIFIEHNNIKIYHTYRNDDIEQGTANYYYTTNKYNTDYKNPCSDEAIFDVHDLPNWIEPPHPPYIHSNLKEKRSQELELEWKVYHNEGILMKHNRKIVKEAIEAGHIHE